MSSVVRLPTKAYLKFDAHDSEVNAIKWTPHGLLLASGGGDRKVKMWDVSKGRQELRGTLTGCNGAVMSLDYDSAGALLLASSTDFACRIWSVDDQRLRHTLTGHSGKIFAAKFMGESTRVCSGSHDRTLKVWDLRSKACTSTLFPGSSVNDLVCLDRVVISGHFDKKIRFYDVRTGGQPTNEVQLGGRVTSVDLARNGFSLLACTRESELVLMDLRSPTSPTAIFADDGFSVSCDFARASFSPDSEYVAAGSAEGAAFVWAIKEPRRPETVLRGHDSSVLAVAWQPTGNGFTTCDKNKRVVVWAAL